MHASRKILLKHFNARAEEYHAEIFSGHETRDTREINVDQLNKPVCLYCACLVRAPAKTSHRLRFSVGFMKAVPFENDGHTQRC